MNPAPIPNSKSLNRVSNIAQAGFAYDAAGNVISDNTNTYLYDAEGRICAVKNEPVAGTYTMTGYLYDANGTRIAKGTITAWSCDPATSGFSTTNDYVLGPSGEQFTEFAMNGSNSALLWQHTNVWAGGKLLGTYDKDGLHFYFNDPLGSRRVQTNYAGVVEQTCQNFPFGDGETCSSTPTEHLFTGKERDTESGNDYFGARYYSSAMGRFMSPDWSAKAEPVPYAKLDDPQSLNLYAYVGNNPLTQVDADGHCWPQWLCNKVAQAFINVATLGVVAYIHHEAKVTAQHRQYLIDNGYTLVNGSNKEVDLKSASAKEVNQAYGQAQADQFRQALGLASQIPTVPGAGSIAPEEGTGGEATPESAQMKRLSNGEIKQLQENGIDPHDLKPNSKYDLFKNSDGEIFVKPKAGNGPGETTGLNIKDYQ